MTYIGTSTAPSYPFPGPKPAEWEDPFSNANRRKPRTYASVDMGVQPRPNPWPLGFCIWLVSDSFGKDRIRIIESAGGTWLGERSLTSACGSAISKACQIFGISAK